MTKLFSLLFILSSLISYSQQTDKEIRLIVRADDMGFSHAANEAIIKVYKQGIVRSAEVLVTGPWFLEAAKMLNENSGLDVGVHLCLTSEYAELKWKPLVSNTTLSDSNGYFFPFLWKTNNPQKKIGFILEDNKPDLKEIEKEFRAQIEMAKRHIKNVTHLSSHMGSKYACEGSLDLFTKLAKEYKLHFYPSSFDNPSYVKIPDFKYWDNAPSIKEKEKKLISLLNFMEGGNTYFILSHPSLTTDETKNIHFADGELATPNRNNETAALISAEVKAVIKEKKIRLISVAESFILSK